MKIFVVDDDSEDRQLIEDTFIGHDAEIEFANDADSAVKRLGEEGANFDKVIYFPFPLLCQSLFKINQR